MGNTMNILNSVFGFGFGNPAPYPYQGQPQMNNYNYQQNMMPNPNMGYNNQYMNMQNMGNQMMNGAVPTGNMNPFYADPNMNAQQQTQMPNPNVAMQTGNSIGAVDIPARRTSQAAKNMVNEPAPAPAPDVVTKTANYTI